MEAFFELLEKRTKVVSQKYGIPEERPCLCIGIDPHISDVTSDGGELCDRIEGLRKFCEELIHNTADCADCYKPNLAFFLSYGSRGVTVLEKLCADLKVRGVPVILDAKFGDISTTADAYAEFVFGHLKCGAVTVNPLMGGDCVRAFLNYSTSKDATAVFVLCKTSNPGSADIQCKDVISNGGSVTHPLFMEIAELGHAVDCELKREDSETSAAQRVALVIGATDTATLSRVRKRYPHTWVLTPGVGFQGGNLEEIVISGTRADSRGLIIPISRAISRAPDQKAAAESFLKQISSCGQKI